MPRIGNTPRRSSTVRQPRETPKQGATRQAGSARSRVEQPRNSRLMNAAEGFAVGAFVGWELPWLKSKVVLGDRMTALLTPALLLAQAGTAVSLGAICSAARLVKGNPDD